MLLSQRDVPRLQAKHHQELQLLDQCWEDSASKQHFYSLPRNPARTELKRVGYQEKKQQKIGGSPYPKPPHTTDSKTQPTIFSAQHFGKATKHTFFFSTMPLLDQNSLLPRSLLKNKNHDHLLRPKLNKTF